MRPWLPRAPPSAWSQRLAARRGKKRASIAVAHAIMVRVFHRLSRQESSRELGANSVDERRRQFTVDRLTRRIEHLGYWVHLEPVKVSWRYEPGTIAGPLSRIPREAAPIASVPWP